MKKILLAPSLILTLLFSTVTFVKADDGDGHDVGRHCTENINCPPPPQQKQNNPSDQGSDPINDVTTVLLELITAVVSRNY